jgi:hypothetical protein
MGAGHVISVKIRIFKENPALPYFHVISVQNTGKTHYLAALLLYTIYHKFLTV